ncbi:MAG: HWE histidine kinase domain-containing protein [Devosia sp.]
MLDDLNQYDFLAGGGEMGERIRAYDWQGSEIGSPDTWPQSLRVTVRLMLNTGHPMFIWWGPNLIQFYNDAYRHTMGPERHPSALGQRGRECWDEIWPIIGPQIDYVMSGKGATWNEDALVPVTRHGRLDQVYWTYSYGPIDLDGSVGGVLVVCTDVTEQHLARERLRGESGRLRTLFEQAPGFMAILRGPQHVFELTNASYRRMVGDRDLVGKSVRDAIPDAEGQGFFELLDGVLKSREPYVGRQVPLTLAAGEASRTVYVDFIYQPIFEADGAVTGVFVEGSDVTDHVNAQEHLRLINFELKHRVKNTLAMVSAIASQTFQSAGHDSGLDAFRGRLDAFGRAHDILTAETWATAQLTEVVAAALESQNDGRIFWRGTDLTLGSKQALSLSLALHELATNASKYGALSLPEGRIDITWAIVGEGRQAVFDFEWRESGGPPVYAPTRRGFGSRLIERVLAADFGASPELSFAPDGLRFRVTTLATKLSESPSSFG